MATTRVSRRSTKPAKPVEPDLDDIEEDEVEEDEIEEAPAPRKRTARKTTRRRPTPKPEDDEDDEEEETKKPAPKKKTTRKAVEGPKFSAAWLTDLINEKLGSDYKEPQVRALLRRLANKNILEHEARARWSFTGPKDPEVTTILKAIKSGEMKAERDEKLQALKDKKTKGRARKAPEPDVEDLEDEDEDLEDDDE